MATNRVTQVNQANLYGPLPQQLWHVQVTVPTAATGVTYVSDSAMSGVAVRAWIKPTTLAAGATVKVYDYTTDVFTVPTLLVDYTAPNPAVQNKAILADRVRVQGHLACVVASAVAGDVFDLYILVDPNADDGEATIGALGAGTALIGKVGIDQATANANEVVLKAGTNSIGSVTLNSAAYSSRQSAARPDNATPLTAGDCVGAIITFPVGPTGGGEVIIDSASLEIDVAAVPAGMTSFKLHLYSVTPPSALVDNDPWNLPAGDRTAYLGYISFLTPVAMGATPATLYTESNFAKQIKLASANLFAYLVTDTGYTPTALGVKAVTVHTLGV